MIRFNIARILALSGSLIVSPFAIGQQTPRADSPAKPRVVESQDRPDQARVTEAAALAERLAVEVEDLTSSAEAIGGSATSRNGQESPKSSDPTKSTFTRYITQTPVFHARTLDKVEDALESNFGLTLSDADDALRSQLEIPAGQGVVVVGVKPGSLAEHAGLKQSDVLLSLGDQKVGDVLLARKTLLGLGKDALEVKLIRGGKPNRMSLVGPEHGFPPEAAEYWIGVPVSPIDATLRTHLPALTADAGLVVNDVVKGSPAAEAGIQKNDILVTMGGKPLKTPDSLIEQIQAAVGKPVSVEIIRAGKPISLNVTPAKRVHPTTINVLSRPGSNYRFVRPNVGVELDANQALTFTFEDYRKALGSASNKGDQKPLDLQLRLNGVLGAKGNEATSRIEAQLKDISTKLEEIQKAIDGMRKAAGK